MDPQSANDSVAVPALERHAAHAWLGRQHKHKPGQRLPFGYSLRNANRAVLQIDYGVATAYSMKLEPG